MKRRTGKIRLLAALLAALLMASQCVTVFAQPADAESEAVAETVTTPGTETGETETGDTNADEMIPAEAEDTSDEDPQEAEEASEESDIEESAPSEDETLTSSEDTEMPDADASEEEILEYLTSTSSNKDRLTGHLPMPGQHDDPAVVDFSLDYNSMKAALNDSRDDEYNPGATQRAQGATAKSKAFPYSWRDEDELLNYLTENYPDPRDQTGGTCWAHAAIANSEFYMITHGMENSDVDFSEKHLAYWAYTQGTTPLDNYTGDTIGCTGSGSFAGDNALDIYGIGGNAYMAALTLMQRRGIADEATIDSYLSDPWNEELPSTTEREDVAYLKNAYMINRSNTSLIKDVILKTGLVGVSIAAYDEFMNDETAAFYCPFNTYTNHDVCIVGWDDDYPRDRFDSYGGAKPSKNGAWLIRNSWNTEAEIDYTSYFWLSYEDKAMDSIWAYEVTDSDYDNNYFYDSQIHPCNRTNATKSANIYQARSGADFETLEAVSFDLCYMSSTNVKYTIDVYTDVNPAIGPESGTKAVNATTSGIIALGGMYTIPLENPVALESGDYYSVVITLSDKKSVNYETDGLGEDQYGWEGMEQSVGMDEGQSFIFQNGKWIDLSTKPVDYTWVYRWNNHSDTVTVYRGNLGIHALTSNGGSNGTISLDQSTLSFSGTDKCGDTKTLTATVLDAEGNPDDSAEVNWFSDDRLVATVDDDGTVTAVGNGTATITASSEGRKAICTVNVNLAEHTVTIDANGGILTSVEDDGGPVYEKTRVIKVLHGDTFRVENPKRVNCDFVKWVDANTNEFTPGSDTVEENLTIKALWDCSETAEAPEAYPGDGSTLQYGDPIRLYTPDSTDSEIRYTLDGNDPDENSELYTEPIPAIPVNTDTLGRLTVKAIAIKKDYNNSAVATFEYLIERDADAEWGDIVEEDDKEQVGIEDGYPKKIPDGLWIADASYSENAIYTGSNITFPGMRVFYRNRLLQNGRDYTVTYTNNLNAADESVAANKRPTITVTGKGNYSGKQQKTFVISQAALPAPEKDTILEAETGKEIKPVPTLYYENPQTHAKILLKNNTDFKCEYDGDCKSPGPHTITVTGKGNFTGTQQVTLTIVAKADCTSIAKATVKNFAASIPMSADPDADGYMQPAVTVHLTRNSEALIPGDDYAVSYYNNKTAGTATMVITGLVPYTGSLTKTFKITQLPIKNAVISNFEATVGWDYESIKTGAVFQEPVLKYNGFTLEKGRDYTLAFKNNNKSGKATMTITGKGRYSGSISKPFTIQAYNIKDDIGNKITIKQYDSFWFEHEPDEYASKDFDGRSLAVGAQPLAAGAKLILEVCYDEDGDGDVYAPLTLAPGCDYTVTYAKNKRTKTNNKGCVTITGKGVFCGKISADFTIPDGVINLETTSVSAPDLVRSAKKNGLFSTPTVWWYTEKLKAGSDYSKKYTYTYYKDALLTTGIVRAGSEVKPEHILREGESAMIKVTVYDTWQYTNTSTVYSVKAGSVSKAKITVHGGKPYDYSGGSICPGKDDLVVKVGNVTLKKSDYDIIGYDKNDDVGNAKIFIRGRGDYVGETTAAFRIGPRMFLWWTFD